MNESRLAVILLSTLRHFEHISFDEFEKKFEKFDKRNPGVIKDFDLDTLKGICEKHPYELQVYTEGGNPAGIKRGKIWSDGVSRVEIEKYCFVMDKSIESLLRLFIYT